jgi:serine/threonine protein kinase
MGIMVIIVPPLDHLLVQYYGSYSLHQWLLCHDWLPNLEARLALDEEAARRVGDDRTGGPEVSRQLRLLRVIMRDLLIGLNYVHSRGLAHTELRLQNVHISAADRHVKVGILGNAADFPGNDFGKTMVFASSDSKSAITRRLMIAFDIR